MLPDYSQRLLDIYQTVQKQILAFAELNLDTFNKVTKSNGEMEAYLHAKKPEDMVQAHLKAINKANQQITDYMQRAVGILVDGSTHINKQFSDFVSETAHKTSNETRK